MFFGDTAETQKQMLAEYEAELLIINALIEQNEKIRDERTLHFGAKILLGEKLSYLRRCRDVIEQQASNARETGAMVNALNSIVVPQHMTQGTGQEQ